VSVLVVCAVAAELAALRTRAQVDVVAVGVGPVEAALGTARALAARSYRAVINAGIAGGFRARTAVGDGIVVALEHYIELGLEDHTAFALPGGVALIRRAEADPALVAACENARIPAPVGSGITSAIVTTTDARAALLEERFGAHVESMEGFAVLRAAHAAGVPALEVRGVSNLVGDRLRSGWDFRAGAQAAVATAEAILDVLLGE
jgi:futalosine hydrolase